MEEFITIPKEMWMVALSVWVVTFILLKIPAIAKYFKGEVLAFIIGIIAIVVGFYSGYFGDLPLYNCMIVGIITLVVAQLIYDKIIKAIADNIINKGALPKE
ncbi:MAG: hypothetical protein WC554_02950 [Clostridia bacterium]